MILTTSSHHPTDAKTSQYRAVNPKQRLNISSLFYGKITMLALLTARSHMMLSAIEEGGPDSLLKHITRIIDLAKKNEMSQIVHEAEALAHHFNDIHESDLHSRCNNLHNSISTAFSQCSYS